MGIVTKTLDRIETHLNYAAEDAGFSRKLVPIHDGHAVRHQMTLDKQGFVLRRHEIVLETFSVSHGKASPYLPVIARACGEAR